MRYLLAILTLASGLAFAGIAPGPLFGSGGAITTSSGGRTQVFSYPSGFTSVHGDFTLIGNSAFADPNIQTVIAGTHVAGSAWYNTKQNIASFTTEFTFQITNGAYGFNFVIQNDPNGTATVADANGIGYFTYTYNEPDNAIHNSVAIVFNNTPNTSIYVGSNHSLVSLAVDGGDYINSSIFPNQDLGAQGIVLNSGDVMDAIATYDGSTLVLNITDTSSGGKATYSWPLNIPSLVGASTAYVGFTGGGVSGTSAGPSLLTSWTWWNGYDTELAAPTFSPSAGQYASTQSVSISGPAGATIYYTTNGRPPTAASSVYSVPLTVSSNELIQAVAVESTFTNSPQASANYLIQSSGAPTVNFPTGFSGASGLIQLSADAAISGSNLVLTDGINNSELGGAFYAAPVNISSFTSTFTYTVNTGVSGAHNGLTFLLENQGLSIANNAVFGLTAGPGPNAVSATISSDQGATLITRTVEFSDGEIRTATIQHTTLAWSTPLTTAVTLSPSFLVIRTGDTVISGGPYGFGAGQTAGNAYGAQGMGNSVGVVLDNWNNAVGLILNGEYYFTETAITGLTLGLNPDLVTVTYDGTTLSLTIKDTVTSATFSPPGWAVNIPSEVGGSTAYVGFTAGSSDSPKAQQINNWTGF